MNTHDVVQYSADNIGLFRGIEDGFLGVPEELPCFECGGMVSLSAPVTMRIMEADGSESEMTMTEAEARSVIGAAGVIPPPVMCSAHERLA